MLRIKLFVATVALALTGAAYAGGAQDAPHNHDAHKRDAAGCCKMAGHQSADKDEAAHSCCAHKDGAGCCGDSCQMMKASAKDANAKSAEHKGDCCAAMSCADKEHKHAQATTASSDGAEKMSCCADGASCCADGADCCKAHKKDAGKATATAASGQDKAHVSCCGHGNSCCQAQTARR
ncbi:MAG TPA: hypothetical protein VGV59_00520 [Pyrinomonadaceae bacterium]|nr:hypothetical protein [Pyrinomonadaceae bacterium]